MSKILSFLALFLFSIGCVDIINGDYASTVLSLIATANSTSIPTVAMHTIVRSAATQGITISNWQTSRPISQWTYVTMTNGEITYIGGILIGSTQNIAAVYSIPISGLLDVVAFTPLWMLPTLQDFACNTCNLKGQLPSIWSMGFQKLQTMQLASCPSLSSIVPLSWVSSNSSLCSNSPSIGLGAIPPTQGGCQFIAETVPAVPNFGGGGTTSNTITSDALIVQTLATKFPQLGWDPTLDPCSGFYTYSNDTRSTSVVCGNTATAGNGDVTFFTLAVTTISIKGIYLGVNLQDLAFLSNLTNLNILEISGAGLTGTVPVEFNTLRVLATLDLSSNFLSGPLPEICRLSLGTLLLNSNQFSSIPDTWFTTPTQMNRGFPLTSFNLAGNYLTGNISSLLTIFTPGPFSITNGDIALVGQPLNLQYNFLIIDAFPDPQHLSNSYYTWTMIPQSVQPETTVLTPFQLLVPSWTGQPCLWVGVKCGTLPSNSNFTVVTSIRFSAVNVTGLITTSMLESLSGLPYLTELDISFKKISDKLPNFSSFPSLSTINLMENHFTCKDFSSKYFPSTTTQLNLGGNRFTGVASFPRLSPPINLQLLNLSSNSFSSISPEASFVITTPQGTGTIFRFENNTDSVTGSPKAIVCPYPVFTSDQQNNVVFLHHDPCSTDLTTLKILAVVAVILAIVAAVGYPLAKKSIPILSNSVQKLTTNPNVRWTSFFIGYGLSIYDVYNHILFYSNLLSFMSNELLNVRNTCPLFGQTKVALAIITPTTNMTFDILQDVSLLVQDTALHPLSLSSNKGLIDFLNQVPTLLMNSAVVNDFGVQVQSLCTGNNCIFGSNDLSCTAPSTDPFASFKSLVYLSIATYALLEAVAFTVALIFALSKKINRIPGFLKPYISVSTASIAVLAVAGPEVFLKEILSYKKTGFDMLLAFVFNILMVNTLQFALSIIFVLSVTQQGLESNTVIVIVTNILKLFKGLYDIYSGCSNKKNKSLVGMKNKSVDEPNQKETVIVNEIETVTLGMPSAKTKDVGSV